MEHNHHYNGMLGTSGMIMSAFFHWLSEHSEGLNHAASVAGIWIGLFVSILSGINIVRNFFKKRKRGDEE